MIYLKKSDGTIEQYADDLQSALHLDKQLAEQREIDFGEIYTAETLPDEDRVAVGIMTQAELSAKITAAENTRQIAEAKQYLAETDYKIIKEFELGEICPADIKARRIECRALINNPE